MKRTGRGSGLAAALLGSAALLCFAVPPALAAETSVATPTLTATASPGVVLGGSILDAATIAEGSSATGELTFTLYGPDDPSCSKSPAFRDTKAVSDNAIYDSSAFTPTEVGTYSWTVSYGGDANNGVAESACNADGQTVTVSSAPTPPPTVSTATTETAAASATSVTPGINTALEPGYIGYINDLNAEVGRIWLRWCEFQDVAGSGSYDMSTINVYRNIIRNTEAHGIQPLLVLATKAPVNARPDAMQKAGTVGCAAPPIGTPSGEASIRSSATSYFGDAAQFLVYCLKGNLTHCPDANGTDNLVAGGSWGPGMWGVEIGNETNSADFWQKGTDTITRGQADIYGDALTDAAAKIHSMPWSSLKVSSAGLSYGGPDGNEWGQHSVDATSYLIELLTSDRGIDAVGIHPYGPGIHPSFTSGCTNGCETHVQDDLYNASFVITYLGYSLPIWITEVGSDADCNDDGSLPPCDHDYPYRNGNDRVTASEELRQAADLAKIWDTIRFQCTSANVPLAVFWTLADHGAYETGEKFYAGFLKRNKLDGTISTDKQAYQWFTALDNLSAPYRSCYG